jgi:hypothetical protein
MVAFLGAPSPLVLTEDVDYTHTGWRAGEAAFLDAPPVLRYELSRWNEAPDKRAFNRSWIAFVNEIRLGYEAALTEEQKAERSREAEARMMAEAHAFYTSRAPGDNRSFWD